MIRTNANSWIIYQERAIKIKLTIYSDYVRPWCYVGQGVVERFKSEHGAEVEWRPFYLRPGMPPEGIELPDYLKALTAQTKARLKEMATAVGLEMVFPTHIPNTRLAHEATEYARQRRTSKLPMTFLPSQFVFLT